MEFITTKQIVAHREGRKKSGLVGCIDGSDTHINSLSNGISWRPADPMNPHCFCHDCRTTWDPEGSIDLELIKEGNERACFVYASILPTKKEILTLLMSNSDDALEEFVKAQIELFKKNEAAKSYQEQFDGISKSYHAMIDGRSYTFLKFHEAEIDELESKLTQLVIVISQAKEDVKKAEATVREKEKALSEARQKIREFVDKNI